MNKQIIYIAAGAGMGYALGTYIGNQKLSAIKEQLRQTEQQSGLNLSDVASIASLFI